MITNNHDVEEVKSAANGRWKDILPSLTGIDATLLDEKNHPCPKCGGTDRFRCLDANAGVLFCNQCFNGKNGDGIAAIQWLTGWKFPEALQAVAESLNLPGSLNGHATNGKARGAAAKPSSNAKAKRDDKPKGKPFATADKAKVVCVEGMRKCSYEPGGEWAYLNADGKAVAWVLRFDKPGVPKEYRPVSLHDDGWYIKDPPGLWPLYQLPAMLKAGLVFVPEGEKAADAVRSIELTATASAHGSQSASKSDWTPLAGKEVVILPDHDHAGEQYAEQVTTILLSLDPPAVVKIIRLPGLPEKGDFVEWLAAQPHPSDHDEVCNALLKLVEAAEPVVLNVPATIAPAVDRHAAGDESETTHIVDEPWPAPPCEAAFHGVAGDIVRLIEPHSEADPVALLIQLLVVMGNICGRHRYCQVESTRHYPNLFAVLVGSSSTGRKGTAGDNVIHLIQQVDPVWAADRKISGLVSGEGVTWNVRDPVEASPGVKPDDGVRDKRLMAYESEFSSVLKCKGRESNTLGEVLRQAWDSGNLRISSKNSPARATNAHVSLIGHITGEGVRGEVSERGLACPVKPGRTAAISLRPRAARAERTG
jgi:Zinc-binding domain of primase-helicase